MNANLANGKIWVGDGSDNAQPRTLSGDITMTNTAVSSIIQNKSGNIVSYNQGLSMNVASGYLQITNDLITGKLGGQTIVGGINLTDILTFIANPNVSSFPSSVFFDFRGGTGNTTSLFNISGGGNLTAIGALTCTGVTATSSNVSANGGFLITGTSQTINLGSGGSITFIGRTLDLAAVSTGTVIMIANPYSKSYTFTLPPNSGVPLQVLYNAGNGNTYWDYPIVPNTLRKIIQYNGVVTAGMGVSIIVACPSATGVTNTATILNSYTTPATADADFVVSFNVRPTTSTVHNFTVTCTYTDETNTSQVLTMQFSNLAGTLVTAVTNAAGTVPYEGVPLHLRCKAGTTITGATAAGGTYTGVVYNIRMIIEQKTTV